MLFRSLLSVVTTAACTFTIEDGDSAIPEREATWVDPFANYDLVDLTYALSEDSLYWPNGSPFEYERQVWGAREDGEWYAMGFFSMPEHLGTHLDAPIHFAESGWTNAEIDWKGVVSGKRGAPACRRIIKKIRKPPRSATRRTAYAVTSALLPYC